MQSYETIKGMAKELGRPVSALLALATINDPFYVGTPTNKEQAAWFADVWSHGGFSTGAHLRRLHYWCVSQATLRQHHGKPYENTEECWKYLCEASKRARYLGLVEIADIADHKAPAPTLYANYGADDLDTSVSVEVPSLEDPYVLINANPAAVQPYHLEVWIEKSTMDDVLDPICRRYHANLITGEGEMSITAVYDLVQRIRDADRPCRVFYVSDFDPAGNSMPRSVARKAEWLLQTYGITHEVKLTPLVLTAEQVQTYQLPRTPIKESERRGASFEERYGVGAVELDALEALHPGTLATLVSTALSAYHDLAAELDATQRMRDLRHVIRAQVQAITDRYQPEIEALEAMCQELRALNRADVSEYALSRADVSEYALSRAAPMADDTAVSWLFDSTRPYLEQMDVYQRYRHGNGT